MPVDGSQGPKLDAAATEDQTQRDSWACASSPALVDPLPGETRSLGNITAGQQAKKRRGSVQAAPSAKRLAVKGGSTAKPATAATPGQQASNKQDQKVAGLKPAAGGPSTGARQPSAPKPRSTQGRGQGPKGIGTGGKPAGPAATDLPTKTAHPNIKVRDDGKFRVFLSSQGLKYLHSEHLARPEGMTRAGVLQQFGMFCVPARCLNSAWGDLQARVSRVSRLFAGAWCVCLCACPHVAPCPASLPVLCSTLCCTCAVYCASCSGAVRRLRQGNAGT